MWFLQLLGLLPKALDALDGLRKSIYDERMTLINAKTAQEKQASLERLGQLEAQASILNTEANAKNQYNAIFRSIGFGIPSAIAFWKLVIWDNVISSFVGCNFKGAHLVDGCKSFGTPDFSDNVWYLVIATACFYLATSRK